MQTNNIAKFPGSDVNIPTTKKKPVTPEKNITENKNEIESQDAEPKDSVNISEKNEPENKASAPRRRSSGEKIKYYYDKIEPNTRDKETSNIISPPKKDPTELPRELMGGMVAGCVAEYGIAATGASTYLHENAHATMVNTFYKDPTVTVQVDGIDNLKAMVDNPSWENLGKILAASDSNNDGAAGVTRYSYGEGLNEKGQALGKENVHAIISAAGCVSEEIPLLMGFAAGFKLRKKAPVLGYTLMTMASIHHLATSSYPFGAITTTLAERPGHDWAKFAEMTGIPPVITAVAFAATLPALGAAMWFSEKKNEEKMKDRVAVGNLIRKGDITPKELMRAFAKYKKRDGMKKAEAELMKLIETPIDKSNEKKMGKKINKAMAKVRKEYDKFSDSLATRYRSKVDAEKKNLPKPKSFSLKQAPGKFKEGVKRSWKTDKVGTSLALGTLAGGGVVTAKAISDAAAVAGSTAGIAASSALSSLIPGVSLVGTAAATYRAGKVLKNPNASKLDKATAVSTAAFSGLCSAGMLIPGLGAPLVLTGIAGILGTHAVKALVNKFG